MAGYKVIQDIESEDKLLGPLTLKAFIYALIAGVLAYINFRLLLIGTPIKWVIILMLFFPMVLFGVLAAPLGREQPTEVWLIAKIRFRLKPRLRLWELGGSEDLVKITAPKKLEEDLGKNLSQNEIQSRLKTLAQTLDTRGWAVKNVDINLNVAAATAYPEPTDSDRLVAPSSLPSTTPVVDIHPSDDILDVQNNSTAQKFDGMMQKAAQDHKKEIQETLAAAKKEANKPADTKKPTQKAKAAAETPKTTASKKITTPVTAASQAVNMELAQSGSAFSVSTLSQLANRQPKVVQLGPNEVSISLH